MFRLTRLTSKIYWILLVFLLVIVGCKKDNLTVPYNSFVGIYHVTGSWHQEIMGVNYPSHPLDEYDTISYKYPNMLCLGTDYYFPYYYVTMATDTSHFYSFNQYAGGDGQNLEVFYFPKPYNDSIYMISIVAYNPAENTTYYKAGIKVQ